MRDRFHGPALAEALQYAQLAQAIRHGQRQPFEPNRIKPAPHRPPPAVYENDGYVIEGEFKVID